LVLKIAEEANNLGPV